MRSRLSDESGVTLVELLISMALLAIVLAGVSNAFVSGLRAGSASAARTGNQEDAQLAVNRLEYEIRCSSGATVSGGGSTVVLTLPSECIHATGSYTWCVANAELLRYSGSSCSGTGQVFASNVTTATPFSLLTVSGALPRLQVSLAINASGSNANAIDVTDQIALRNAARS